MRRGPKGESTVRETGNKFYPLALCLLYNCCEHFAELPLVRRRACLNRLCIHAHKISELYTIFNVSISLLSEEDDAISIALWGTVCP